MRLLTPICKSISVFSFICLLSIPVHSQDFSSYQKLQKFMIGGSGGWDYLVLSPVHEWLYVSHGTQVNIIHAKTGDSIGVIPNTTGVHGIAFSPLHGKGFTSNGRLNNVTVFDINTNQPIAQIKTGENPDAILYDAFTKKIITCNGRGKNLSILDPTTNQLLDSIYIGGKPETAVSDGEGNCWVNVEDKNEIQRINLKTMQVIQHFSIEPGEEPTGLAYDKLNQRLFAGCDKKLIILDALSGKFISQIPIGAGCDGVAFDPVLRRIYTSNGADGTLSIIKEVNANQYTLLGNLPTQISARTITIDTLTHAIYLPAAEVETPELGATGRPKAKPGTFHVLMIGSTDKKK